MEIASILWRRLEPPGHDACRLTPEGRGWRLEGAAVFLDERSPAKLLYRIGCDSEWRTRQGEIQGWIGTQPVQTHIIRTRNGSWFRDGMKVSGLEECVDLDFGFTPATNLPQLRRIALRVGEKQDVPVAWLELPASPLRVLRQRYERRTEASYWYEAAEFGYAALLEVTPAGFVASYPRLWRAE